MSSYDLNLYEEIALLSLRDEEGTVGVGMFSYAAAGAIVMELLLQERLELEGEGRKQVAALVDSSPMGDVLLDEALELIAKSKKPRSLQHWISKFAGISKLKHKAVEGLCKSGILRDEEDRVLFIFPRRIYPENDPRPEELIIERLRSAILGDAENLGTRTTVLVALANQAGALRSIFERKELKARKERIKTITDGDAVGQATKKAIDAMQAAIAVSVITSSVVAATVASSS